MADCTALNIGYLLEPLQVSLFVREACAEKSLREFNGQFKPDYPGPEAEDIHVVVLHTLMC